MTQKNSTEAKNLRFKVRAVVEGREDVLAELPRTYAYRNKLAAIERQRRADEEKVLRARVEGLAELADAHHAADKAVSAVWDEYRERNRKARTKTPSADIEERVRPLKAIRREAAKAYYAAHRKAIDSIKEARKATAAKVAELLPGRLPEDSNTRTVQQLELTLAAEVLAHPLEGIEDRVRHLLRELNELTERSNQARREARGECGMYWGTYLLVEKAADAFCADMGTPQDRRYAGEGAVGVQLQKGIPIEDAFACTDSRLRLQHDPQPHISERDAKWAHVPKPTPGSKKNTRRIREDYLVYMRIGSHADRSPKWAVLRVWLEPERLPPGSRITYASLHREILAGRERWSLLLQTALPVKPPQATPEKACGIDVGYRVKEDGSMRVAVAAGSDGEITELSLDAGYVREYSKVFEMQARRDEMYNEVRAKLRAFAEESAANRLLLPQAILEAIPQLDDWYTPGRLAGLIRQWGRARGSTPVNELEGALFAAMKHWQEREFHLWQYQENLRDQLQANRKDRYRVFARRMRERYGELVVESLDLNELHDVKRPEEERKLPKAIRSAARLACLSDLLRFLRESGAKEHPPENTTRFHLECSQLVDAEFAKHYLVQCPNCHREFDQDVNAARVLLLGAGTDRVKKKPAKKAGKDGKERLSRKDARAAKIAERQKLADATKKPADKGTPPDKAA